MHLHLRYWLLEELLHVSSKSAAEGRAIGSGKHMMESELVAPPQSLQQRDSFLSFFSFLHATSVERRRETTESRARFFGILALNHPVAWLSAPPVTNKSVLGISRHLFDLPFNPTLEIKDDLILDASGSSMNLIISRKGNRKFR